MNVGIIGCGAIANIIVSNINTEKTNISVTHFFDNALERAENLAQLVGGVAVLDIEDMIDNISDFFIIFGVIISFFKELRK